MSDYGPTELGRDAVESILNEWVETAFKLAGGDDAKPNEPLHHMRWLYLAEPWLPAGKIIAALELAGWVPPRKGDA